MNNWDWKKVLRARIGDILIAEHVFVINCVRPGDKELAKVHSQLQSMALEKALEIQKSVNQLAVDFEIKEE